MSGGHFSYVGYRLRDALEMIAGDEDVKQRWPALASLLESLGDILYKMEHEIAWDLSGDSQIPDDAAFERHVLGSVLKTAMKTAPDEWFPYGKWTTIQAVQDHADTQVSVEWPHKESTTT